MLESKFQKQVKKVLEKQGAFIINIHGHGMQKPGLPDLLVIHPKWTGFLELKTEKNKCSEIQQAIACKIKVRGMPIYVLRNVEFGTEIYGCIYQYYLENFDGGAIAEILNLNLLLQVLIEEREDKTC